MKKKVITKAKKLTACITPPKKPVHSDVLLAIECKSTADVGLGYDKWRKRKKVLDCRVSFFKYVDMLLIQRKANMSTIALELFWQLHLIRKELAAKKEQK